MDPQLIAVSIILAVTMGLIILEIIRIDLVAIMAMLALVWTGVISPGEARSGFASNAVLAVIAVMILGRGLENTGVTDKIGAFILRLANKSRRSVVSTLGITVGAISGFIQNIGAAALFLPVATSISSREQIPASSLLMPMGFAALLGGTLTMVGTSSLIVLNDLLEYAGLEPFGLFDVTPIGMLLLVAGIGYFYLLGPYILPAHRSSGSHPAGAGHPQSDLSSSRRSIVQPGETYSPHSSGLTDQPLPPENDEHGYVEVVIPSRSNLVGHTLRENELREQHNVQVVAYTHDRGTVREDPGSQTIRAGDTMVLHGKWKNLRFFADSENFVTVTPVRSGNKTNKSPVSAALAVTCFAAAIGSVVVLDLPISIGFLTGAAAMLLTGVLTIEEAYQAIELKVVFLLAGLIPIGIAMENSGMAALLADSFTSLAGGFHPYLILLAIGALMTAFSLTMSNIAATVLMVPLVLELGDIGGLSPRTLVLQVGLCAANSFLIPTHHVNALLMTPGGYRTKDYVKAGTGLSVLFILISTTMLYLLG